MAESFVLNNIVSEVKKLSEEERIQLLKRIRLANYLKSKPKPIAKYNSARIKPPTMAQIDKWKHEARKTK